MFWGCDKKSGFLTYARGPGFLRGKKSEGKAGGGKKKVARRGVFLQAFDAKCQLGRTHGLQESRFFLVATIKSHRGKA